MDRHADIVADKAELRCLINVAGVITDVAYSEWDDVQNINDNAEKTFWRLHDMNADLTLRLLGKQYKMNWKK